MLEYIYGDSYHPEVFHCWNNRAGAQGIEMSEEEKNKEDTEAQEIVTPEQWKSMTTKDALAYWTAIPSKIREPALQKDLAEILGVSQERLCQIKREDEFHAQVNEYRKVFFKQFTSNIIDGLRKNAEGGDHKAAKLFLQYVEDFKETTRSETEKVERQEFVFILGEVKWGELRKKLQENVEFKELKYLEYQKIESKEEEDEEEEAEEAEICESIDKDKT